MKIKLLSPRAWARTLKSAYELVVSGIQQYEVESLEDMTEGVRSGDYLVFCAYRGSEIIGVSIYNITPLAIGLVVDMYVVVDEKWRGHGLFRLLTAAAHAEFRRRNPNFLGILAEMDTSNYGVSATDRRVIFRKVGYQRVDFQYTLPPLEDGESGNSSLILVFLPEPGIKEISAETFSSALKIYLSWVDEFADPLGRQIRDGMLERLSRLEKVMLHKL